MTLNVTDIDRAKGFYQSLGWRLDADFAIGDDFRIVQFTPPHSQCSIHFGQGLTTAGPGGPIRLILAVADIDAARADLISHGADVSDVYHYERQPGRSGELESRVAWPRPGHGALVLQLRVVQRSRRQPLAAPGDHQAAPRPDLGGRPGGRRGPGRAAEGHGHPPWLVRGGRPAARLVGLVRGVHARAPGRERRRRGRRDGQPLHGRGQARRRLIRLTPGLTRRGRVAGARARARPVRS